MARKQRVPESQLLAKVILWSITFAATDEKNAAPGLRAYTT